MPDGFDTEPTFVANCHCTDCKRASGGERATIALVPDTDFTVFSGKELLLRSEYRDMCGSLPDWLPYISKSELSAGGRVRHLATLTGDTIVERLEAFDNAARSYSYSILEAPFPVSGYLSTLRVQQAAEGNRSRVEWSGKFTPEGVSAAEASRLFRRIFEDGLKALAIKFT